LLKRAADSGVILLSRSSIIDPLVTAGDAMRVTSVVNVVEGWKLATLAFIVGLEVAAGAFIPAVELDAEELAVKAFGSKATECGADAVVVGCGGTGCSLEEPVSTFLMADLFAIFPDFADEPLASDKTEASVRPDTLGAVSL
jgi:hypothetical protein